MSNQVFSSNTPNTPSLCQCAPRMTPDGTNAAPSLVERYTPDDGYDYPIFIDGVIDVQNIVEKNDFNCHSVKLVGAIRDTGERFSNYASTPTRVNVFKHGDPNPIDPSLVDKRKWNGSALVFPYTTNSGKQAWRFEALSFDLEAGPIIERVPQSHATNPFMSAQ